MGIAAIVSMVLALLQGILPTLTKIGPNVAGLLTAIESAIAGLTTAMNEPVTQEELEAYRVKKTF